MAQLSPTFKFLGFYQKTGTVDSYLCLSELIVKRTLICM